MDNVEIKDEINQLKLQWKALTKTIKDATVEKRCIRKRIKYLGGNIGSHPSYKVDKHNEVINQFKTGKTMQEIAEQHGVSRQRVQQILKKSGLTFKDGGKYVRPKVNEGICKVDDCDKIAKTKGYCGMHYERLRAHGTLDPVFKNKFEKNDGACLVEGCPEPFKANGLCHKHNTNYYMNKRFGNVSDLNDFLNVQKAKSMMGKSYVKFEDIRNFMIGNKFTS